MPQTQWLKTIETYSLTVMEARSPKSGRTVLPPGAVGRILPVSSSFGSYSGLSDL